MDTLTNGSFFGDPPPRFGQTASPSVGGAGLTCHRFLSVSEMAGGDSPAGDTIAGCSQPVSSRRLRGLMAQRPAVQLSAFMKLGAVTPSVVSAARVSFWGRDGGVAWPFALVMFVVGMGCTEVVRGDEAQKSGQQLVPG